MNVLKTQQQTRLLCIHLTVHLKVNDHSVTMQIWILSMCCESNQTDNMITVQTRRENFIFCLQVISGKNQKVFDVKNRCGVMFAEYRKPTVLIMKRYTLIFFPVYINLFLMQAIFDFSNDWHSAPPTQNVTVISIKEPSRELWVTYEFQQRRNMSVTYFVDLHEVNTVALSNGFFSSLTNLV